MTYSEDHIALAAEYALGTLAADERALVETMMIVDPGFREVVEAWDRKLGPLQQMVAPIEPPPHLWESIKAAAGVVPQVPAAVEEVSEEVAPVTQPVEEEGAGTLPAENMPLPNVVAQHTDTMVAPSETPTAEIPDPAPAPEVVAEPVSSAAPTAGRRRGGFAFGTVMTVLAATLAGVIALQVHRPDLLPEQLRVKPKVEVVRVAAPPPPQAAQSVAVLQQSAALPAFILTVDAATKNLTVRRVGAAPQPGKSYELWLVSDKLQRPRSLGVIGGSDFTIRPSLADYDSETINRATYTVTLESEGGSPTGVATGPTLYTGRLVESVPELPAQPR
jgi:anti-sigma-K factor RskA